MQRARFSWIFSWMPVICLAGPAPAQVVELGTSILTTANAIMPGCTDTDGMAGATEATAACASMGYSGASSAQTSLTSSTSGGEASAFAEAAATSIGPPGTQTASAAGTSIASVTWDVGSDTHYSLSVTQAGGTAAFEGTSGALPPSGVITDGIYTLSANASAFAFAQDANGAETVTVGPLSASARVSFAPVGSPTLILGTVTSGGAGLPGLVVEAIVAGMVVATAQTGDDGTYLLPGLPGVVILRVSDPSGELATQLSSPQTPPATFDVELSPAVPALPGPLGLVLALALVGAARRGLARGSAQSSRSTGSPTATRPGVSTPA